MDLEARLSAHISQARGKAVQHLADEEEIDIASLNSFLNEYDYLQREKIEIIRSAVGKKKVGLKERRTILERVIKKLRTIIDIFNWN